MEGAEKITFLYVLQPKNFDSVIIRLKKKEVLIRWIRFPSSGLQRNSVQLCSHRSESLGAKLKLRSKHVWVFFFFFFHLGEFSS